MNAKVGFEPVTTPVCGFFAPSRTAGFELEIQKERKKTDNPKEGWKNGTPPPHRDFKGRGVMR